MTRSHRNVHIEILLGLVLTGCSVDEGSEDVAVSMDPIVGGVLASAYPEAAILNIDVTPSMYYACSGTLIAPRVVLTAGHCVVGHQHWDVYVGSSYQASTTAAVYDWPVLDSDIVSASYHDIGLVFLSNPIALAAYPALATTHYQNGTKALNVGRDVGPDASHYQVTSSLYEAPIQLQTTPVYPYDYSSVDVIQPGDSGGPVFLSGTHTILAVNSGAAAGVSEVMARVDLVATWISAQVTSHGGFVTGAPADASSPVDATGTVSDSKTEADRPIVDAAASADANVPAGDAAAKADANAPTADSGSTADAAAPGTASCVGAIEKEPNNTWPSATAMSREICGALYGASDVDWYSVPLDVGTHTVEIVPAGDATMNLGIVNGSTCTLSLTATKSAAIRVTGSRATACVEVLSAKRASQTYYVLVTP